MNRRDDNDSKNSDNISRDIRNNKDASNCRRPSTSGLPETEKTTTNTYDASTRKGTFNMVQTMINVCLLANSLYYYKPILFKWALDINIVMLSL
jgi:hypothetical protein